VVGRLIWDQAGNGLKRRRNDTVKGILVNRAVRKHVGDIP
jgi:hypothetical protein